MSRHGSKEVGTGGKWVKIAIGIFVILAIFIMIYPKNSVPPQNYNSVIAEHGTLSVVVVGSGKLEYDDTFDIKVPSGIEVSEVLVETGDVIKKGDAIATIDSISIGIEIESVLSQLKNRDSQIDSELNSDVTQTIKANVDGRVKKIYALEGEFVADVYEENRALIELSIDGKMAVDIESDSDLSLGDELDVVLENGSIKSGTVEKASEEKYTITITDNGPKSDENVTIKDKNGRVLASGILYINQPIRILATKGEVKTIHVSENQRVDSSNKLITIDELPESTNYKQLLVERNKLLDKLDVLLELEKANILTSNFDGVIMSLYIEDETVIAGGNSDNSDISGMANTTTNLSETGGQDENMVIALSVAPSDKVKLSVEIDELDILSIETGMTVEVSFDAISNKKFDGNIIKIADSGNATSGVTKYPVKVLLTKDDSMRVGMNATATILVKEQADILIVPVITIQEREDRIFVYTEINEETGEFHGEVEVITGVSDGENVEIVSGLEEGTKIYYPLSAAETIDFIPSQGGYGGQRPVNYDGGPMGSGM